jgi:histidinol-phosphate/aromatic aminotransferase/cobyric acid decarboxylase-like protein/ribosomal protein S18 acetylase RimI-like enzyme
MKREPVVVVEARPEDRDAIDVLRHRVYAEELGQYGLTASGRLADAHPFSTVLCAKRGAEVVGYLAITPPGSPRLRIEHYVARDVLPFSIGPHTAEARQLTVHPSERASTIAVRLLLACVAWLESRGVRDVVTIGHDAVVAMYERYGAQKAGIRVRAGSVDYDVLYTSMSSLRAARARLDHVTRLIDREDRALAPRPARCVHGGRAIVHAGSGLETIEALDRIVDADVLDAWFPPSPRAIEAITRHAVRLARTSPPPSGEPLIAAIAARWAVAPANVALGAGSSDLVYRAFCSWLHPGSRVLIVDPSYGEYAHVVREVIGASLTRLAAPRRDGYALSMPRLRAELSKGYDLVVLVNPSNPTGALVDRDELHETLREAPSRTRVWIDEAYVHHAGEGASLLAHAAASRNLFVSRSFSKSLALSGLRAAFLVGPPEDIAHLVRRTPPWIVGFPGQVAVLRAFEDDAHYASFHAETRLLRSELAERLRRELRLDVFEGYIASVLVHLDARHGSARLVCERTRRDGVFVRDGSDFGPSIGSAVIRVSVKDRAANERIVLALGRALTGGPVGGSS